MQDTNLESLSRSAATLGKTVDYLTEQLAESRQRNVSLELQIVARNSALSLAFEDMKVLEDARQQLIALLEAAEAENAALRERLALVDMPAQIEEALEQETNVVAALAEDHNATVEDARDALLQLERNSRSPNAKQTAHDIRVSLNLHPKQDSLRRSDLMLKTLGLNTYSPSILLALKLGMDEGACTQIVHNTISKHEPVGVPLTKQQAQHKKALINAYVARHVYMLNNKDSEPCERVAVNTDTSDTQSGDE